MELGHSWRSGSRRYCQKPADNLTGNAPPPRQKKAPQFDELRGFQKMAGR